MKRQISIRIDGVTEQQIEELTAIDNTTKTGVIARAVERYHQERADEMKPIVNQAQMEYNGYKYLVEEIKRGNDANIVTAPDGTAYAFVVGNDNGWQSRMHAPVHFSRLGWINHKKDKEAADAIIEAIESGKARPLSYQGGDIFKPHGNGQHGWRSGPLNRVGWFD